MCGDFGDYEYRAYGDDRWHEDRGIFEAMQSEHKTNEEAQREYDEKHRVW